MAMEMDLDSNVAAFAHRRKMSFNLLRDERFSQLDVAKVPS
jgi:hypothetical protein